MILPTQLTLLAVAAAAVSPVLGRAAAGSPRHRNLDGTPVNSTTCNGKSYSYNELAGYGVIPSDARDKFGDTIGGIGSASECRVPDEVTLGCVRRHAEQNYTNLAQLPWTRARGRRRMTAWVTKGCCGRCRIGAGE